MFRYLGGRFKISLDKCYFLYNFMVPKVEVVDFSERKLGINNNKVMCYYFSLITIYTNRVTRRQNGVG